MLRSSDKLRNRIAFGRLSESAEDVSESVRIISDKLLAQPGSLSRP